VEALASGTPVVATRCGGPEDIVLDGVGELVPIEDSVALADALSRVLADAGHYDRTRLRRFALERFSWDTVVDRVHDVYRDAVR
jgi:glycosyltransferase involved in cell wall biosynthesis